MDPELSVGVATPAPDEVQTFELPPKLTLQLPSGFLEKPHVRHALKYMEDDEQREKALKAALAWKERFAAKRWTPVLAAIERRKNEDSIRSLPQDEDSNDEHPTASRSRAMTAPVVSQPSIQATPSRRWLTRKQTVSASLPSASTAATITPRQRRWDILTSSPATPLTPILLGNSFSSGGFWSVSTQPQQYEAPIDSEPEPLTEPKDPEAREVYTRLKRDIDGLARKYCLARFRTDTSGKDDFIPECMIKPRDTEEAAKVILNDCKVDMNDAIVTDLPERLRRWALDERQLQSQLCIKDATELSEQNDWMNDETLGAIPVVLEKKYHRPPSTSLAVSILDEQREALRRFRIQRNLELIMEDSARDSAWVLRMLEDAEYVVATDVDVWSNDSGDDGYDYSNFLRSIKREMSTSESSGALSRMVEEVSNSESTSFRFPSFPSTSPSRSSSHESHLSTLSSSNDSSQRSTSICRRPDLHVATDEIRKASTSEVSPEDREFRHRGPELSDLNQWAEELKRMANRDSLGGRSDRTALKHLPPGGTKARGSSPTNTLRSQFSSLSSEASDSPNLSPRALYARSLIDTSPFPMPYQDPHHSNTLDTPTSAHRRRKSKSKILFHRPFDRFKHRREGSNATVVRTSGISITKADAEEWVGELARMEDRERVRQGDERERASRVLGGGGE
ncbi:hypothetical protein G6514_010226 [Epicoccum nigrum]|nr:hypothetical protein G6514_010226 [Epicoccum nigrum]